MDSQHTKQHCHSPYRFMNFQQKGEKKAYAPAPNYRWCLRPGSAYRRHHARWRGLRKCRESLNLQPYMHIHRHNQRGLLNFGFPRTLYLPCSLLTSVLAREKRRQMSSCLSYRRSVELGNTAKGKPCIKMWVGLRGRKGDASCVWP